MRRLLGAGGRPGRIRIQGCTDFRSQKTSPCASIAWLRRVFETSQSMPVQRRSGSYFSATKDVLGLRIEDTGDGFDLNEAKGKGGLGLISMEERVRLVSGKFTIKSQPGEGTTVEVFVPLRAK